MPFHPFPLLVKILISLFFLCFCCCCFPNFKLVHGEIFRIYQGGLILSHAMEDVSAKIQMPALPSSDVFWTTYITILSVERPVDSFCPFKDQSQVAVISGSLFHLQGADFEALTRQLDI